MLECRSLTVRRGAVEVIPSLDLEISTGVNLLLGDNGAGKSTLLATILGLVPYQRGELTFGGRIISEPGARASMYYLPERFQPPWYLTGYEFLSYALGLRAQSLDRRRADVVASKLTLDPELLRRRASEFSKGMTQKLGLVAAFLSNARMLVLDEPTSGLDPTARAAFLTEVEAAYIREQRSFLMTTHALGDATRLSGSVHACLTLMRSGRLVRQGQLPKLLAETRLPDLDSIYANAQ